MLFFLPRKYIALYLDAVLFMVAWKRAADE